MNVGVYIISDRNKIDPSIIQSMHNLRYKVFYEELGWIDGLIIDDQMESDIYDTEKAFYVVKIDDNNQVIASCRLISTQNSYMLKENFSHVVEDYYLPNDKSYWEISRVCIDSKYLNKRTALLEIIASIMEFGIQNNIQYFISYTLNSFIKKIKISGWQFKEISGNKNMIHDSTVLLYPVDFESRGIIHNKARINSLEIKKESDYVERLNFEY